MLVPNAANLTARLLAIVGELADLSHPHSVAESALRLVALVEELNMDLPDDLGLDDFFSDINQLGTTNNWQQQMEMEMDPTFWAMASNLVGTPIPFDQELPVDSSAENVLSATRTRSPPALSPGSERPSKRPTHSATTSTDLGDPLWIDTQTTSLGFVPASAPASILIPSAPLSFPLAPVSQVTPQDNSQSSGTSLSSHDLGVFQQLVDRNPDLVRQILKSTQQPTEPVARAHFNPSLTSHNIAQHLGSNDSSATPGLSSSKSQPPTTPTTWVSHASVPASSFDAKSVKAEKGLYSSSSSSPVVPVKRRPGRPRGSTNKKAKGKATVSQPDEPADAVLDLCSDSGEGPHEPLVFTPMPTAKRARTLVLSPQDLATALTENRTGQSWEIWEKMLIVSYIAGRNAPPDRLKAALETPKSSTADSHLSLLWRELAREQFNNKREPHLIANTWWVIVAAFKDIRKLEGFTGGGGRADRDPLDGTVASSIGKRSTARYAGKGSIQDWEVKLWKEDSQNGMYTLMYNAVNGHPAVDRSGNFRSGAVSPPGSFVTHRSSASQSVVSASAPPLPSSSSSAANSAIAPRIPHTPRAPSQLSVSHVSAQFDNMASGSSATNLEMLRNSNAEVHLKKKMADEAIKARQSQAVAFQAQADLLTTATQSINAVQHRNEDTAFLDLVHRLIELESSAMVPVIQSAERNQHSENPIVQASAIAMLQNYYATADTRFEAVLTRARQMRGSQ